MTCPTCKDWGTYVPPGGDEEFCDCPAGRSLRYEYPELPLIHFHGPSSKRKDISFDELRAGIAKLRRVS
jgi:hypothetical protein